MEAIPTSDHDKFDPEEVRDLQAGLKNSGDPNLATEMLAGFLVYNGYGANRDVIRGLVANGMSKAPFDEFKRQLESIALDN